MDNTKYTTENAVRWQLINNMAVSCLKAILEIATTNEETSNYWNVVKYTQDEIQKIRARDEETADHLFKQLTIAIHGEPETWWIKFIDGLSLCRAEPEDLLPCNSAGHCKIF